MNIQIQRQGLAAATAPERHTPSVPPAPLRNYLLATAACAAVTAAATPLLDYFDPPNIVMLFLLVVLLVAMRLGYGPGVMSACLSVALFDFFFVPPRFSFAVHDMQYLLTFAIMLAVALITAHLSARLREQAACATGGVKRAHALYEMARALAGTATLAEGGRITIEFLRKALQVESVVLLRQAEGSLRAVDGAIPGWVDMSLATDACSEASSADLASQTPTAYFPLIASRRIYGVLAVRSSDETGTALRENAELLDVMASLASIVIERLERA